MIYKLTFSEKDHVYKVNGQVKDSVTQITKDCVDNSAALVPWAVSETLNAIKEVHHLNPVLESKARNQWKTSRDKAADIGTIAHKAMEKYLKEWIKTGSQPDISDWTFNSKIVTIFNVFLSWIDKMDFQPTHSEERLYSPTHDFVGTIDAIGVMNGTGVLLDFKTGKNVYPEHYLQLGAYLQLARENGVEHVPIEELWIIRIGRDGAFEPKKIEFDEQLLVDSFLHALKLKKFLDQAKRKNNKKILVIA